MAGSRIQKPLFVSQLASHHSLLTSSAELAPALPEKQCVEVSFFQVKCLILHPIQPKANDQHGKGKGEEPGDHKHNCPCIKPCEVKTEDNFIPTNEMCYAYLEGNSAYSNNQDLWDMCNSVVFFFLNQTV